MSKIAGELNAEMMKKVIHDRRAKLFAEIVAKTGSKQSVIDRAMQEIESLREQVEKLTKERDDLRSRRCEVCGYLEHEREHTGCLREQLAALNEVVFACRTKINMKDVSRKALFNKPNYINKGDDHASSDPPDQQ